MEDNGSSSNGDSNDDSFEKVGIYLVGKKNKNKYIFCHYPHGKDNSDFEAGFYEAMDLFKYMWTHFSIATTDKLWPPKSEYDKKKAYGESDDDRKILKWNYFWEKYEYEDRSPWKFYDSLDDGNKSVLYNWYKKNVKK